MAIGFHRLIEHSIYCALNSNIKVMHYNQLSVHTLRVAMVQLTVSVASVWSPLILQTTVYIGYQLCYHDMQYNTSLILYKQFANRNYNVEFAK